MRIAVSPFRLVKKQTITGTLNEKDLTFKSKDFAGKKFLIKVMFQNVTTPAPELQAVTLSYNDLGTF